MFYQYCNKWKLNINGSTRKILIFNSNTRDYKHNFKIENKNVKEYKYLEITFTKLNNFRITKNTLKQQANKAIYFVLSKSKDNYLSTECKLKMFDSVVLPLLLYGCELWGYEKVDIFHSVQLNFLRHIIPVKIATPIVMLYGEFRIMPIELTIYRTMV